MESVILAEHVYKDCILRMGERDFYIDLIPLAIRDFDIILGMDWLSSYHASIDCFRKEVTFHLPGEPEFQFIGERNVVPNCLISAIKSRKLLSKGCTGYLAYVVDVSKEALKVEDIPVVREFSDVFPGELPGLPPDREVEFSIELIPGTGPISLAPYRMAPTELKELKVKL